MKYDHREYEKETSEIKKKILHYDTKLAGAAFDVDRGLLLAKADIRYYSRKVMDLYKELDEFEITHHHRYSASEIGKIETKLAEKDAKLHSMMVDEERFGVSYKHRIAVQQFDVANLKSELDKAKHFKDK